MNRHSLTYKLNDQLSLDDLRAYQADQLSGPARHRIERLMLENPFYADALEGLDALQQVGGSLKSQTHDLHIALQERVHESATPRRLMPLWVTSMVASVLLVMSVAIYLIFNKATLQKQAVQVLPHQIEPGTVLIDPKDLGTSEAVVAVPKTGAVAEKKSSLHKLPGKVKRATRNERRISVKEAIAVVKEVPESSSFPIADEMPILPHIESEVHDHRHVNTERAFFN
ncbi:MAG TPA: hypothetical protein VGA96_05125 [Fibrella sp.]